MILEEILFFLSHDTIIPFNIEIKIVDTYFLKQYKLYICIGSFFGIVTMVYYGSYDFFVLSHEYLVHLVRAARMRFGRKLALQVGYGRILRTTSHGGGASWRFFQVRKVEKKK